MLLSSGIAWDESCHCGISVARGNLYEVCRLEANRMKQRCNSLSVVLFGYGSLHKACRLRAHRCNVGANIDLLGYGSLHEACRLRADGCNKDGMKAMGQAAISCTGRKPPGSCRGAPSDSYRTFANAGTSIREWQGCL
jgi:hypothetical protein